jgi:methyl-accepting chemotaxis protein
MFLAKNHSRADAPPLAASAEPAPHRLLLQQWMSLASMQQRVIQTLAAEIVKTSDFVETEADSLAVRFQRLAVNAQQQTALVDSLTDLAMGIDVDGKTIGIDEVARHFESALGEVVAKILLITKDSTSMAEALDALGASIRNVGKSHAGIDAINSSLNMLALNARIEAERAGAAGAAFRVVANEVRDLSKSTQTHATTMKAELRAMINDITTSHATLKRVATVDLTDDMLARERLEVLLKALVQRNGTLKSVVASAVKDAKAISTDVEGIVTGIQFQDRTKQRLEHVVDTLHVIGRALEDIRSRTEKQEPGLASESVPDTGWVKDMLSRFTMSDMREQFVAQVLNGKQVDWGQDSDLKSRSSATGSMELF